MAYPPPQPGGYPATGGAYPPPPPGGAYPVQSVDGYPPASGGYGQPPAPGSGYGQPPAPGDYGAPPTTQGYPPAPGGYGQPPASQGGYGQPPAPQGGYGQPPTPQGGYGQPPASGDYGAPPTTQDYPPASSGGYPGFSVQPPVQSGGYGQPHVQTSGEPIGGHGAPPQQPPVPSQQPLAPSKKLYQPSPVAYPGSTPASTEGSSAGEMATMINPTATGHGTVVAHSPFDPEEDCLTLRKMMRGTGADVDGIMNLFVSRTNKQRQEISSSYKRMFAKILLNDLKSELGSDIEEFLIAMMMPSREYDVYCLQKAMFGAIKHDVDIIEILVCRTNKEIEEIKEIYQTKLRRNLEKDVVSESSGHFKRLLVSLCNASRDESSNVDVEKARQEAQDLYSDGEKKWTTDESKFYAIMSSRSMSQLCATFEEYVKVSARDIYNSIARESSGDCKVAMLALVGIVRNPSSYFATRIFKSIRGAGHDYSTLIRCVVSRSEIDMVEVKREFLLKYHRTLSSFIQEEKGLDYKKLLMAFVGN